MKRLRASAKGGTDLESLDYPTQAMGGCVLDQYLRDAGWGIWSRPRKGKVLWTRREQDRNGDWHDLVLDQDSAFLSVRLSEARATARKVRGRG